MDAPQRIAIVTRRFWPCCGPVETSIAEVAAAIKRAGYQPEILTIRWEKNWPRNFTFREVEVTRLGGPVSGPWGTFRFARSFSRHIRESGFDGVIVFGLSDESWAAIRSCVKQLPVIVKIDSNDVSSHPHSPFSSRRLAALRDVKQVLVDSRATADWLIHQNDLPVDLVSVVSPGVEIDRSFQRSLARQGAARLALSDAHPILMIEPAQPLVVCGSPKFHDPGMFDLVESWRFVLDRFPQARLWVLGDGLGARAVWERICDLNLANSVVMPGFFDDLSGVLQAANLYVHPLHSGGNCSSLVRALSCGVCTIATSNPATAELIEKNVNGLSVPMANPRALAEAIQLGLGNSEMRARLGREALKRSRERFNIDQLVDDYLRPLTSPSERQSQAMQP